MIVHVPRLMLAAPRSGSGKTTIATGIMAALRQRGLVVQPGKVGPDYIDTGYHELASGRRRQNLDTWLTEPAELPHQLMRMAEGADITIIEGVMGLYDGGRGGISSSAEIARLLQIPVVLVIDVKSMGASAAAIACGFRDFDTRVPFAGVILNRLGSATHEAMIREAMQEHGIRVFGAVHRDDSLVMPERHLGLVPVEESEQHDIVERLGRSIAAQTDIDGLLEMAQSAPPFSSADEAAAAPAAPWRLGVARDKAFSFYYSDSLAELERQGAELVYFSPLADPQLPPVDGLLFGGGYPEMFAADLAANDSLRRELRAAAAQGMPIYAECGGYMYLMERMRDLEGHEYPMAGVLRGTTAMTHKLQMVGYVEAELQQETVLGPAGLKLHGHEFHFSVEETDVPQRPLMLTKLRNGQTYPAGQMNPGGNVLGSYLHLDFAGSRAAAQHFAAACRSYRRENADG